MKVVGYHATKDYNVQSIMNRVLIKNNGWKNDLGNGFYCYIDEENIIGQELNFDSPEKNAEKYYKGGKNNDLDKMAILKIECSFDNYKEDVLDLTDPETLASFNLFVKYAKEIALEDAPKDFDIISEISAAFNSKNPSSRRGVVDGFFIDRYIEFWGENKIKAVIMVTATDFDYIDNHKWRVHIPNGCELCIKDISCIRDIHKLEV